MKKQNNLNDRVVDSTIEITKRFLNLLSEYNTKNDSIKTILRNIEIKAEYDSMRQQGIKGKTALDSLAQKYFLSQKNIETVLYNKDKMGHTYFLIKLNPLSIKQLTF